MQPRLAADLTTNERDGGGGLATEGAVSADDAAGRHGEGGGGLAGVCRVVTAVKHGKARQKTGAELKMAVAGQEKQLRASYFFRMMSTHQRYEFSSEFACRARGKLGRICTFLNIFLK